VANPISEKMAIGTIGELLVQLRLLQHGVQAVPPLKDSGNDLIALRGYEVRAVQVKTSVGRIPRLRNLPLLYHLVALVRLEKFGDQILLDESQIYLVPRNVIDAGQRIDYQQFRLSQELVDSLFRGPCS
jgi:hypothetical protein